MHLRSEAARELPVSVFINGFSQPAEISTLHPETWTLNPERKALNPSLFTLNRGL